MVPFSKEGFRGIFKLRLATATAPRNDKNV